MALRCGCFYAEKILKKAFVEDMPRSVCRAPRQRWLRQQRSSLDQFVQEAGSFTDLDGNKSRNDIKLGIANNEHHWTTHKKNYPTRKSRVLRVLDVRRQSLPKSPCRRVALCSTKGSVSNVTAISVFISRRCSKIK